MNHPPRPRPKLLTDDGNGSFTEHGKPDKPRRVIPIVKQSGYLISPSRLTEEEIEDLASRYRHKFYNEIACAKCELYAERHSETCDSCGAYQGEVDLAGPTVVAGKSGKEHPVIKAPLGRKNKFVKWLKHHGFVPQVTDAQVDNKPIAPFKLVRKPYDYQVEAVLAAISAEKGILSSPPRTGKTIMGTMLVHQLRQKTLILAHQREWLQNFHDTFVGNEDEAAFTDIDPARIGFAKTYADFEKYDVCFATFQQFFRDKGMALFERIVKLFPILIVDECQYAPAPESVKLMTKVISRYRVGLSGSHERKDCLGKGTLISTPTGLRNVEDLKPGDLVLSFNHETGAIEPKPVVDAWSVLKEKRARVTLASGRILVCSVCEKVAVGSGSPSSYREVGQLVPGDVLWRLPDSD